MAFSALALPPPVLAGIDRLGFTVCTPIQEKTLPITLRGEDVAGQAQTGTGKTAAFLIAIFTRLLHAHHSPPARLGVPLALVIAPTRELVVQIAQEAVEIGHATPFVVQAVYGGVDYEKQRTHLAGRVDILVGTPGRLIDYHKQKVYRLDKVETVVIDEADRMFDMGFIADLRFLLRRLPPYRQRQSMLFSATLTHRVMELAYEHMNNPVKIEVTPDRVVADKVEQTLFHVARAQKFSLLLGLLAREVCQRTLIFVNTKHVGGMLAQRLTAQGYTAKEITGDLSQAQRLGALEKFKAGQTQMLVATDVASRGLHIDGVDLVVNYDLPQNAESYVHRIGRTARAGATGKAISLADEEYVMSLEDIQAYIGHAIAVEWPDDSLFLQTRPFTSEARGHRMPPQKNRAHAAPRPPKRPHAPSHRPHP